jgi:iron only hydrogenase large subunit-like protein
MNKETENFHHALKVMSDSCTACSHCLRACPTEAIRIRNGKAIISDNKCIDCGLCYKVCPSNAIYVEQDDFNLIFNFKHRIAIVPAVLVGQFQENIATEDIYATLVELGFTHVCEGENSVELLNDFMSEYFFENENLKPLISCFCPAIVRLIQVKYPSLTSHLMPIKQPLDLSAMYYKQKLMDEGVAENEIGIFHISPCAAKIAAIKSPVGEKVSIVNGVINMDLMYNRILRYLKNNKKDSVQKFVERDHLTSKGVQWTLTGGEATSMPGRCVAIDGMDNVIEFLERLENDEITGFDFLELRACDESCAGGILTSWNRFLTVERLRKRAQAFKTDISKHNKKKDLDNYRGYLHGNKDIDPISPRSITMLDEDTEKALTKMQKVRKTMCYLPGFDCGVCGAPSCQALAEDIAKGESQISHCLFLQRIMERNKKLSPDHAFNIIEEIWGENRLDKNCNKKGAENDRF